MNNERKKEYLDELENKDFYIFYEKIEFLDKGNANILSSMLPGAIIGFVFALIVNHPEIGLIFVIIGALLSYIWLHDNQEQIMEEKNLLNKIINHNKQVISNNINKIINENKITVNREIIIYSEETYQRKIIIDDKNKTINQILFQVFRNKNTSKFEQAKYEEILRYECIDKSTSEQIAHSKTSSNSGKALGGAIISSLLVGNATSGAVIGASGAKTTKTTYKTNVKSDFEINIYLNRLQDSIIKIPLKSETTAREIISVLEYILQNKNS